MFHDELICNSETVYQRPLLLRTGNHHMGSNPPEKEIYLLLLQSLRSYMYNWILKETLSVLAHFITVFSSTKAFIGYFKSWTLSSIRSELVKASKADQIKCSAVYFVSSPQNLAEIQTYVNILQQINQTLPLAPNVSLGSSEVRSLCACVSVCVHDVPQGEDGVCLSALAMCLGLLRSLVSQPSWMSVPAFVCVSFTVCSCVCLCVRAHVGSTVPQTHGQTSGLTVLRDT